MGNVKKLFGAAVRLRRNHLGISQEELAGRAGLHRTYISDVERGARNVSLESIHRLADGKGLKTPSTMLYGHIEEPRHRVDHVLRLRELQDETGGFQVFIPLRYQHDFVDSADGKVRNRLQERTTMAAPAESLKTFAVSRLLFDNVPHVKCFWVMHGLSVAQLSLNFGGTVTFDTVA